MLWMRYVGPEPAVSFAPLDETPSEQGRQPFVFRGEPVQVPAEIFQAFVGEVGGNVWEACEPPAKKE